MPNVVNMPSQSSKAATAKTREAGASTLNATSKLFRLPPGLYVARLLVTANGAAPNPAMVSQAPGGKAQVDFLPAAGVVRQTLTKTGDCMVVRVTGEAAVLTVTEYHAGEPQSVRLQIEQLDVVNAPVPADAQGVSSITNRPAASPLRAGQRVSFETHEPLVTPSGATRNPAADVSLHVVGHVQGQGDVVSRDNWIGTPGSNNRLEGFAIRAEGLPEGVRLVYGCKFASPTRKSQVTNLGKFVGTRQKAEAIRSLVFGLEGPGAERYNVVGQVAFSGQAVREIVTATELRGPKGTEHVVGFNLKVVPKAVAVQTAPTLTIPTNPVQTGPWVDGDEAVAALASDEGELVPEDEGWGQSDHADDASDSSDAIDADNAQDPDGAWGDDDIEKLFSR